MAEKNLVERLRNGEKIYCKKCKIGHYVPYNATYDKAHSFHCSNPECNMNIHWDSAIDIE